MGDGAGGTEEPLTDRRAGSAPPPAGIVWVPENEQWCPPAALLGSQRCDAEGSLAQAPPGSLSSLSRPVFCERPRGHVGEHAHRARRGPGAWWRDEPRGWWSWPDATRPADAKTAPNITRSSTVEAVAVHGTDAPEVASRTQIPCRAAGRIRNVPLGLFATAPRVEPIACARPTGHPPPHCTRPVRGDRRVLAPAGAWVWWAWPPPPLPDPTPEQRWRVHRDRVVALLAGLAVLGGLFVLAVIAPHP